MESALRNLDGVNAAEVSLADEKVSVKFNDDKVTYDSIKDAIEGAGYKVI